MGDDPLTVPLFYSTKGNYQAYSAVTGAWVALRIIMTSELVLRKTRDDGFFFFFCYSIKHKSEADCTAGLPAMGIPLDLKEDKLTITYSYSVSFIVS